MIGSRIREARNSRNLSLADVAGKTKVSVATLSRIETDKQPIEVEMLLVLAKLFKVAPQDLLGSAAEDTKGVDPLAKRIAALSSKDRIKLWREVAAQRRSERTSRRDHAQQLNAQVEELVAQLDYLREEVETVRTRIRRRK
ncbi:MAG TPA: helix-turn-helix transcriptional regulator [Thermoanaerobaculia bacterium]